MSPVQHKAPGLYFVSYTGSSSGGGVTFGSMSVTVPQGVRGPEDVLAIQNVISRSNPNLQDVVVLSWQRYEGQLAGEGTR